MSRSQHKSRPISKRDLCASLLCWVEGQGAANDRNELIRKLEDFRRKIDVIGEKGGYTMVCCAGNDVTIYRIS